MAENDIYNNKSKYEKFKAHLNDFAQPPQNRKKRKYYCKNSSNLKYFEKLFTTFESQDVSYIRRNRILCNFKLVCHTAEKDLASCDRDDINSIVAYMHSQYTMPKTKADFIKDLKHLWKILFPDKDEKGRADETIVPYVVRHLSTKVDKSKEKLRKDKLTFEEFEKIVIFFANDPRLQFYLALSLESLGRPQELLYLKVGDIELYENYAKIYISEHGKEGCGFLQCIDSYPYLIKWLNVHPFRNNMGSYLFINTGNKLMGNQLTPGNINLKIHRACKVLNINKPVTCYSIKRNGVTFRRLRGDSDLEIQHAARWSSTRQLKTYDMSDQNDAFKKELIKRGLLKPEANDMIIVKTKECLFCHTKAGYTEISCPNCKRPFDQIQTRNMVKNEQENMIMLKRELSEIKQQLEARKPYEDEMAEFLQMPEVIELYKTICLRRQN